MPKAQTGTNI